MLVQEQIEQAKATLAKITAKAAEAQVDAATGAAKTASAVPFPANIPLLIGFGAQIAGILATVVSAVRTAKSATSKLGASGGGGFSGNLSIGGGISGGTGFNPATQTISAIPQFTNTATGNNQTGVRAYVIENEITNQQALAKRLDQRATL